MKQTIIERVEVIDRQYMKGELSKDEAIKLLVPLAKEYNEIATEKAKKYPMFAKKPRLVKPEVTKSHGAKLR